MDGFVCKKFKNESQDNTDDATDKISIIFKEELISNLGNSCIFAI